MDLYDAARIYRILFFIESGLASIMGQLSLWGYPLSPFPTLALIFLSTLTAPAAAVAGIVGTEKREGVTLIGNRPILKK